MEGYRLFRKYWKGGQGGCVALYVSNQLELMELHLGKDKELTRVNGSGLKEGKGQVTF